MTIPTQTVDKATAIANIKNILNQNKTVWFAFFLPNSSQWNDFRTFWWLGGENSVYDIDKFCGTPYDSRDGGGHAVLCVGYNDTDASNSYWIILNSWGNRTNRPSGLFYIDMNSAYDCVNFPYYSFYWQTLNVTFNITATTTTTTTTAITITTTTIVTTTTTTTIPSPGENTSISFWIPEGWSILSIPLAPF